MAGNQTMECLAHFLKIFCHPNKGFQYGFQWQLNENGEVIFLNYGIAYLLALCFCPSYRQWWSQTRSISGKTTFFTRIGNNFNVWFTVIIVLNTFVTQNTLFVCSVKFLPNLAPSGHGWFPYTFTALMIAV